MSNKNIIIYSLPIILLIIFILFVDYNVGFNIFDNGYFDKINSIVTFFTFLYTIIATIIAIIAYYNSNLKPNLVIDIYQEQGETTLGQMKDAVCTIPVSSRDDMGMKINCCRPLTIFTIKISNNGKVIAKNCVIQIFLYSLYFRNHKPKDWQPIMHNHGGGYCAYQYIPINGIVYPEMPIFLPKLYFSGETIESSNSFKLEIKYIADNTKLKHKTIIINGELDNYANS